MEIFGENVHCFFIEPTKAPCMLLGMATEKHNAVHIAWATGGSLVPEEIRKMYENTMLEEV